MVIGNKTYSEILITDKDDNLLVSITDADIIEYQEYQVVCVPMKDN